MSLLFNSPGSYNTKHSKNKSIISHNQTPQWIQQESVVFFFFLNIFHYLSLGVSSGSSTALCEAVKASTLTRARVLTQPRKEERKICYRGNASSFSWFRESGPKELVFPDSGATMPLQLPLLTTALGTAAAAVANHTPASSTPRNSGISAAQPGYYFERTNPTQNDNNNKLLCIKKISYYGKYSL